MFLKTYTRSISICVISTALGVSALGAAPGSTPRQRPLRCSLLLLLVATSQLVLTSCEKNPQPIEPQPLPPEEIPLLKPTPPPLPTLEMPTGTLGPDVPPSVGPEEDTIYQGTPNPFERSLTAPAGENGVWALEPEAAQNPTVPSSRTSTIPPPQGSQEKMVRDTSQDKSSFPSSPPGQAVGKGPSVGATQEASEDDEYLNLYKLIDQKTIESFPPSI